MKNNTHFIENENKMVRFGSTLSNKLRAATILFLNGKLGTGKTTLARGILRGLGFYGNVKSPTYTLVETYSLRQFRVEHFDLYRITDAQELIWIGIEDYFQANTIAIIEWPERGAEFLPTPDITINITHKNHGRDIQIL